MSILRTLNTGATGLTANGDALGVVGDNIANANTVGFKRSRANFEDMVANAGRSDLLQIGAGSRVGNVQQMFNQGALVSTTSPTDLALAGEGFFVVQGNAAGVDGTFYTRAGQFSLDKNGYMVNAQGLKLQGYQAEPSGRITGTVGDMQIPPTTLPSTPTGNVSLAVNLDSTTPLNPNAFDPADPARTSNFSSSVTVYDSLGTGHQITVYYTHTSANSWTWNATAAASEIAGAPNAPTDPSIVVVGSGAATGSLTFDTEGALTSAAQPPAVNVTFNGAAAQDLQFDFAGTTGFSSASNNNSVSQDGYAAGSVSSISINETGEILGSFSNGQLRTLGQVAVASFRSSEGLSRAGGNLWARTQESGEALIGTAGTAGRGTISSATLEQSNVDMGREFVDLIAYQRGFQASSKVITTADQLYGELVNLIR